MTLAATLANFYPRPPRGGRPQTKRLVNADGTDFYPRPPRGGRPDRVKEEPSPEQFLSTPSARRATFIGSKNVEFWKDFYPRPPRGGRQGCVASDYRPFYISIHALREEGDNGFNTTILHHEQFLSTPSARRATEEGLGDIIVESVFLSTPSARRATQNQRFEGGNPKYFYPRPPRGGRPHA